MVLSKRSLFTIAAVCLPMLFGQAGVAPAYADAEARGWRSHDYPYSIIDQSIEQVVKEFGHNVGLSVDVSPGLDGRVRKYEHTDSSGAFIDYLEREHGLDWVFDGRGLFLSSEDERVSRSWSGGIATFEMAKAALADADIGDERFPLDFNATLDQLSLSAPPRYVTLAGQVIDRLLAPKATRTVNVIRGRSREGGT